MAHPGRCPSGRVGISADARRAAPVPPGLGATRTGPASGIPKRAQPFHRWLASQSVAPQLRVKRMQGESGVWEMTWAADRRATFSYGAEVITGQLHIIWRRIGTHDIFRRP